jgi:hypothetical protein
MQPLHEVVYGEIWFQAVALTVEAALVPAGKIQNCLSQGFAGHGAGMHRDAAYNGSPLNNGRLFTQFSRLYCSFLAGGAAADYDEIMTVHEMIRSVEKSY